MQRYQLVHASVHAAIAALLYVFLKYVTVIEQSPYADYIRGGAVLVLPFLFNRSAIIANALIESVPVLSFRLRKLLSGRDFIEGDWPLVVLEEDRKTLKYFGFLTIVYKDGQHLVYGDDWNPDGTPGVKFSSQQSTYEKRRLQYWYAQGPTLHQPSMFGYTNIYFFPEHGLIERQAGELLDKEHKSLPFFARRIKYARFARRLGKTEDKFAAAKSLWSDIQPKIEAMRGDVKIERDFV